MLFNVFLTIVLIAIFHLDIRFKLSSKFQFLLSVVFIKFIVCLLFHFVFANNIMIFLQNKLLLFHYTCLEFIKILKFISRGTWGGRGSKRFICQHNKSIQIQLTTLEYLFSMQKLDCIGQAFDLKKGGKKKFFKQKFSLSVLKQLPTIFEKNLHIYWKHCNILMKVLKIQYAYHFDCKP